MGSIQWELIAVAAWNAIAASGSTTPQMSRKEEETGRVFTAGRSISISSI
jgi:hypothetical protein